MSKQVRVNIRSVVNKDGIKHEKRNGRDVIIVSSATLPDDIVMNGIKYPADEIENSYETLNDTIAPLGHPMVANKFVSAKSGAGLAVGYVGITNENVRRENGRVLLDKVIDVEKATESDGGKSVLNAISSGDPIHTSTGLLCELEAVEADDHKFIARNIYFDHDAILLNEEAAATPDQGVGMLVNGQLIEVVNSSVEDAMRDLDWAVDSAFRAMEKLENAPLHERLKTAFMEAFFSTRTTPANNIGDADMTDKSQFDELSAKVNSLTDSLKKLTEALPELISNAVKPLVEAQDEIKANQEAKDKVEFDGLVEKIIKASILDEETAKELTLNSARKLAEKAKPGKAAPVVVGNFGGKEDDEWAGYDMNTNFKKEEAI